MLERVRAIVEEAGKATLEYFGQELVVEAKADDSPLTQADRASHEVLVRRLAELPGRLPVLSEESAPEEVAARRSWERFWLVDPLDGTKEFLKRTGEFTVNVALIEGSRPVMGVVHQPTTGRTFLAAEGEGAHRAEGAGAPQPIRTRKADLGSLVWILSASHASPAMKETLAAHPEWSMRQAGSSLKFCLVAAGEVDLYPRMGPTMEWDTGAAQCVVEQAGGKVLDLGGRPLAYNKEELLNPSLVTVGDLELDWRALIPEAG